ncbi:MAG: class I SAM-dependent methyltransferase [Ilumatobacteraceae bacterium]
MTPTTYSIRGGQAGKDRLAVLSRVLAPTTGALLDRIPITRDARCLDVGCGGGDVTAQLAARVPDGTVVGTDRDDVKIALARADMPANVELRVEDVARTVTSGQTYDIVYARFLLSHLCDASAWVTALVGLVAPGGWLVVEDVRISGSFCSPPSPEFARSLDIYCRTVRANGGDPNLGPALPRHLRAAGLADIGIDVVPAGGPRRRRQADPAADARRAP